MSKYFLLSDSIYDLTTKYPETLDFFLNNGFENFKNEALRSSIGKTISIERALELKHLNKDMVSEKLDEIIRISRGENSLEVAVSKNDDRADISIQGILPCPVRLQALESFDKWLKSSGLNVNYELPAASMGLDWLKERILKANSDEDLADMYLSSGFSLFFDNKLMGKYRDSDVFAELREFTKLNKDFDNDYIDLKDPKQKFSVIGVIPAVFMVNKILLEDRKVPESWEDILKPEFEGKIALPVQDLDLFNAILLSIYKLYGVEGVRDLGKGMSASMHPAQMLKAGAKADAPIITIMPYFFTWMAKQNSGMEVVWPKEGAIISPMIVLTKLKSKEKIKKLSDFIFSKDMASMLSADNKFPSTHPEVDNELSEDKKFVWIGWDFINNNDIGQLIIELEKEFNSGGKV